MKALPAEGLPVPIIHARPRLNPPHHIDMRMTLRTVLFLLAAWTIVEQAYCQPPSRTDPQSAYEPRSGPGAGQKFLGRLAGDWDVVKTFYPRSGAPVRATGTCAQKMIHGGRFLQSEFTFEEGGIRTAGPGLIGYDTSTGRFTSVWTDSRSTRMSLRSSREPFNGSEIVLYSAALGENGPALPRSRTVSRLEDGDRRLVHRQFATTADGKDRLVMEFIMTRRNGSAARSLCS
jgi:hypothetical protein